MPQSFLETIFYCLHSLTSCALTNTLYANTTYVPLFYGTILSNKMASILTNLGDNFSTHFSDLEVSKTVNCLLFLELPSYRIFHDAILCIIPEIKVPE